MKANVECGIYKPWQVAYLYAKLRSNEKYKLYHFNNYLHKSLMQC